MKATFTPEQDQEFQRRADAVCAAMRAAGLRQLVLTDTDNLFYLTGATFDALERPFFLILGADGGRQLVVPALELDHLGKAWGAQDRVSTYREYPAPAGATWHDALLGKGLLQRGFAFEPSMPLSMAQVLLDAGGEPHELMEGIRIIKSAWEIAAIERAAHYADWGVRQILRNASEGALVAETFTPGQALSRKIIRETPDWDPVATRVICGAWPAPLSAEPHAIPRLDMTLNEGPHVAMVLTRVNGYAAESERTFFTTRPDPRARELFHLLEAARERAFALVRPGMHCAELDWQVNRFLAGCGYAGDSVRLHRCGHGFGLGNHEPPWIAEGSEHVLQENMVISIEPGIYLAGEGGYRHSETVLVTARGYRCLTKAPIRLSELVLGRPRLRHRLQRNLIRNALNL